MDRDEFLVKKVEVEPVVDEDTNDAEIGAAVGGLGGAAAGAVAGSLLGPAGAAIGALVGGVAGAGASAATVAAVDQIDDDTSVTGINAIDGRDYVDDDVVEQDISNQVVYGENEVDAYRKRLDAEMEQREAEIAQGLSEEERTRRQRLP